MPSNNFVCALFSLFAHRQVAMKIWPLDSTEGCQILPSEYQGPLSKMEIVALHSHDHNTQKSLSSTMPSLRDGENQAQALAAPLLPGTVRSKPQAVSRTTGWTQGACLSLSLRFLAVPVCTCMYRTCSPQLDRISNKTLSPLPSTYYHKIKSIVRGDKPETGPNLKNA